MTTMLLSFNTLKSFHMHFSSSSKSFQYHLNNQAIATKDNVRDLGVWFSNDLSWSKHIIHITSKAYQTLSVIRRSFNSTLLPISWLLPQSPFMYSLVRSQLTYCQTHATDLEASQI